MLLDLLSSNKLDFSVSCFFINWQMVGLPCQTSVRIILCAHLLPLSPQYRILHYASYEFYKWVFQCYNILHCSRNCHRPLSFWKWVFNILWREWVVMLGNKFWLWSRMEVTLNYKRFTSRSVFQSPAWQCTLIKNETICKYIVLKHRKDVLFVFAMFKGQLPSLQCCYYRVDKLCHFLFMLCYQHLLNLEFNELCYSPFLKKLCSFHSNLWLLRKNVVTTKFMNLYM